MTSLAERPDVATKRSRLQLSRWPRRLLALVGVAVFVVAWQLVAVSGWISPLLVPRPTAVLTALVDEMSDGTMITHLWVTLQEVLAGFIGGSVAGVLVGTAITRWPLLETAFYPLIVAFQALPKIAIAPLIVSAMGFGLGSKVVIILLVAFFPVLVNFIAGVRAVPSDRIDLLRALGASQNQIFIKVLLPSSLPYLFAGLSVGVILSVIGAIVGEFIGSTAGLGYLIQATNFRLDIPAMYAVLVVLAALGLALNALVDLVGKRLLFWQDT